MPSTEADAPSTQGGFSCFFKHQVSAELARFDKEPLLYVGRPVLVDMSKPDKAGSPSWKQKFNSTLQVRRAFLFLV